MLVQRFVLFYLAWFYWRWRPIATKVLDPMVDPIYQAEASKLFSVRRRQKTLKGVCIFDRVWPSSHIWSLSNGDSIITCAMHTDAIFHYSCRPFELLLLQLLFLSGRWRCSWRGWPHIVVTVRSIHVFCRQHERTCWVSKCRFCSDWLTDGYPAGWTLTEAMKPSPGAVRLFSHSIMIALNVVSHFLINMFAQRILTFGWWRQNTRCVRRGGNMKA